MCRCWACMDISLYVHLCALLISDLLFWTGPLCSTSRMIRTQILDDVFCLGKSSLKKLSAWLLTTWRAMRGKKRMTLLEKRLCLNASAGCRMWHPQISSGVVNVGNGKPPTFNCKLGVLMSPWPHLWPVLIAMLAGSSVDTWIFFFSFHQSLDSVAFLIRCRRKKLWTRKSAGGAIQAAGWILGHRYLSAKKTEWWMSSTLNELPSTFRSMKFLISFRVVGNWMPNSYRVKLKSKRARRQFSTNETRFSPPVST